MRNSLLATAAIVVTLLGGTVGTQAGPATASGSGDAIAAPGALPDFSGNNPMGEPTSQHGTGPSFGGDNLQGVGVSPSTPDTLSGPGDESTLPTGGIGDK
jgi:hypothetical protein